MSHTDKYLKYKNKYLELKNQVGGGNIADLKLPSTKTISWFTSILKFLNNYKFPEVTYYVLLEDVSHNSTFLDDDITKLRQFAQTIANKYKINIQFSINDRTIDINYLNQKNNGFFTVILMYDGQKKTYSLFNGY